jgi:hypothetical protein
MFIAKLSTYTENGERWKRHIFSVLLRLVPELPFALSTPKNKRLELF